MSGIIEFLLDRIMEDEKRARLAESDPWRSESDWTGSSDDFTLVTTSTRTVFVCCEDGATHGDGRGIGVASKFEVEHIAHHDPARVVRECEAKREAVNGYLFEGYPAFSRTIKAMAAVYADHPDYDEEWQA